jgi:glycosyltransferase involved in cell wall biosynthesis
MRSAVSAGFTFVVTSEVIGGGELFTTRFVRELSKVAEARIAGRAGSPIMVEAERTGIDCVELDLGKKLSSRTAVENALRFRWARARLDDFVAASATDEVFVFQYKWEQLLWGGRDLSRRVAIWEHGPIPKRIVQIPWTRSRLRKALSLKDFSGIEPTILHAGFDRRAADDAVGRRDEIRASYGVAPGNTVLAFVSRVARDKGILDAVRLADRLPGSTLLVGGTGPDLAEAQALAGELGVDARWLGWVENPFEVFSAADLTVLTTTGHGEGRPMAAIESLSVGTPVLGLADTPAMSALADLRGVFLSPGGRLEELGATAAAALESRRERFASSGWGASVNRVVDDFELPSRAGSTGRSE